MSQPAAALTVLVPFSPDSPDDITGIVADLQAQQGAEVAAVLIDATDDGSVAASAPDGVRCVRADTLSLGTALRRAAEAAETDAVALRMPGSRSNPEWAARALAALDANAAAQVVTTNFFLSRQGGEMAFNINPSLDGAAPPPGWDAALVFRRGALAAVSEAAFQPVLLQLFRQHLEAGAVAHLDSPLYSVSADWYALERFTYSWDHNCLDARVRDFDAPDAWLSVLVESQGDRAALRRCLNGLARQVLPAGTYEIVVSVRGDAALAAELEALDVGLTFRVASSPADASAADALNAGLALCRGMVVILLDEQLTVFPDLVEQHARAHREHDPRELAVLGTTEVPADRQQFALPNVLADGTVERGVEALDEGLQPDAALVQRRNISVPRIALDGVGGFGAGLPDAAIALDLGQRLFERGVTPYYRSNARTLRQAVPGVEQLAAHRRSAARAFVHAVSRHPDLGTSAPGPIVRADLQELLAANAASLGAVTEAAAELGAFKVSTLAPIGDEWRALSDELTGRLSQLLRHLDKLWSAEGWLQALDELGADSVDAIVARNPEQVPGLRSQSWLLAPQGDAEDAWLMAMARYLTGADADADTTLLVLANAGEDGCSVDLIQNAATELTRRIQPPRSGAWPHVLIVDEQTRERPLSRLAAATNGWVRIGTAFDDTVGEAAALAGKPEVDPTSWALLATGGIEPFPVQTAAPRRFVAWPDWSSEADLDALLGDFAKVLVEQGSAALCLRFAAATDGDSDAALVNLDAAYNRHFPSDVEIEVFLFDDGLEEAELARLGVAVDGVLCLPSSAEGARKRFVEGLGASPLTNAMALRSQMFLLPTQRPAPLVPAVTWTL